MRLQQTPEPWLRNQPDEMLQVTSQGSLIWLTPSLCFPQGLGPSAPRAFPQRLGAAWCWMWHCPACQLQSVCACFSLTCLSVSASLDLDFLYFLPCCLITGSISSISYPAVKDRGEPRKRLGVLLHSVPSL